MNHYIRPLEIDTRGNTLHRTVHTSPQLQIYTQRNFHEIPQVKNLSSQQIFEMQVVASVLPFRVNNHVIEELIDWDNVPDDPIFQLVFPQRGMLGEEHFETIATLLRSQADRKELNQAIHAVRSELNPHPAGQMELNVPRDAHGQRIDGLQHKYHETALFFPSQGQTCHSYCSFCFRWAQFVGERGLRIVSSDAKALHEYLAAHREISDLLVTGGDPMVMKTRHLEAYLLPLLEPRFDHVQTVRIGTKALSFWPYRFTGAEDSRQLLALIERLARAGKHVAVMAHYNHWRELEPAAARTAIRRLRDAGATIRSQGPLLRHVNDDPAVWSRLWKEQVKLGIVPYYMFVERDTGARNYFEVPLARAWQIYRAAIKQVSGLARTARGPSMSASPGKVEVQGITEIGGEKLFVLRFIQARNPDWVQRPFFARFDPQATWLKQLRPAFGEQEFFFEQEYRAFCANRLAEANPAS